MKRIFLLGLLIHFSSSEVAVATSETMVFNEISKTNQTILNDASVYVKTNNNNFLLINFINPSTFRIQMNSNDNFPEGGMVRYGMVNVQYEGHQVKKIENEHTIEYIPIPFIMSNRNWGLFMNTTMIHSFDAGATVNDQLLISGNKGILDYYLIAGESMLDVLDGYTDITGKPHLPTKMGVWIYLGFSYGRYTVERYII